MSFIKRLAKDSLIYAVPSFLSKGLSLFLVPLYTRVLSPEDYGVLDLMLAFGVIINLTVAMEISQGMSRYYLDEKDPKQKIGYSSSALWFTIVTYTAFLIIANIFVSDLSSFVTGTETFDHIFRLATVFIYLNGILSILQIQFRGEFRSKEYAFVSMLVTGVGALSSVIMAYVLGWGLEGMLYGMITGVFAGVVFSCYRLYGSFKWVVDLQHLKLMLNYSLPLVPASVSVFITFYIDRILIKYFLTLEDVGLYGIAFRVASVITLIMAGFRNALTPLVYHHYKDTKTPESLALVFRIFVMIALSFFVGMSLFSREILIIMTTPDFYSAASVVSWLVMAVLLSNSYIFAPGMNIAKKTKYLLLISFMGASLNFVLSLILIPLLGIIGAGIASALTAGVVFCIYMLFSQRLYYVPHQWKAIFLSIISACLIVLMNAELEQDQELWLGLSIKAGLGGMLLVSFFATGLISMRELRYLIKYIQGSKNAY